LRSPKKDLFTACDLRLTNYANHLLAETLWTTQAQFLPGAGEYIFLIPGQFTLFPRKISISPLAAIYFLILDGGTIATHTLHHV
jgi:hypothetical protein